MTFRRPVSAVEWSYLASAALAPPFGIQLVVEGAGRLDLGELRSAVAEAGEACPGARLVRAGHCWLDSGQAPPVTVVEHLDLDRGALRQPLQPDAGPAAGVLLVAGPPSTVVFRASHAIMDARGVLIWATQVFRALRGEAAEPALSALTDDGLRRRIAAGKRRPATPLRWPSALAAPTTRFGWQRRTIDGRRPGAVARTAAALAAASGTPSRVMVPVDLRRHAPAERSTANLTLPIFLDLAPATGWEQVQTQLLAALARREELTAGVAERLAAHLPLPLLRAAVAAVDLGARRRNRYLCSALVSHLGRIDLAAFSTSTFTAGTLYGLPVHAPLIPISLTITEPHEHTELTMSYPAGAGADQAAGALLDAVTEALQPPRSATRDRAAAAAPETPTVVDRFAQVAARQPGAVAVTGPQGDVSYAELDARADAVAAELRAGGVGPGAIVGLLTDRTPEAIGALWGILKAGAAYLPLDPQYPDERLAFMLDDAAAATVIVQRRHAPRLGNRKTFTLEELPVTGVAAPGSAAGPAAGPGDLAYVIYTSGSTGRPKGVQIEHRNLSSYVAWAIERYRIDPSTCFAWFTSWAFDLSGTSIFLPLLAGGRIVAVAADPTPATLRSALERADVNAVKLTPTHLDLIGRLGFTPPAIRTLIVGGEQLRTPVAARAQQLFGAGCVISNEYGPTEATIGCVVHTFDVERDGRSAVVPIGLPVPGSAVRLLDDDQHEVPDGAVGEIYLTGRQLGRGYLNRPDADAAQFVRLPDGVRAYRTGDRGRLLATRVLEYAGRTDDQIKIRGYRIEPAEIAAALEQHDAVTRALVVPHPRPSTGEFELYGYVILARPVPVEALTEHLTRLLPPYLRPARILVVDRIPQTVNGKTDTSGLPVPVPADAVPSVPSVPFRPEGDGLRARVARIWSEVLRVDVDGNDPDVDFHQLGGDSIALLEMLTRVGAELGAVPGDYLITNAEVISRPTIASICRALPDR